jgi:hypothetical protein
MSVDGLNVLNGSPAGFDQKGYLFSPRVGYQITGWRKNDAKVAAFTLTDVADSYAACTGQTASIGVIGVALFRERQVTAYDTPTVATPPPRGGAGTHGAIGTFCTLARHRSRRDPAFLRPSR